MIDAERHSGPVTRDSFLRADDRFLFRPFNVHLDEIHFRQPQFLDDFVNRRQRNLNELCILDGSNKRVTGRGGWIDSEAKDVIFVPHGFWVEYDAAIWDFIVKIAP